MSELAVRTEALPWERIPDESAKAYQAFCIYRNMLGEASLVKAAEVIHETAPRRTVETIRRQLSEWSRKYAWVERTNAYVDALERRFREQRESELDRIRAHEMTIGGNVLTLALHRMNGRRQSGESPAVKAIDWNEAELPEVLRAIELGLRWRRLGAGMPTEIAKAAQEVSPADLREAVHTVIEIALSMLPVEAHSRFLEAVRSGLERR